eukprot:5577398-Prymnesium_polylepis.1
MGLLQELSSAQSHWGAQVGAGPAGWWYGGRRRGPWLEIKNLTLSERSCDLEHGNRLPSAFASSVARGVVLARSVWAVFVIKLVTLSMSITLAASLCLAAHMLRADQAAGCKKAESRSSFPSMSVVLVAVSFFPDK